MMIRISNRLTVGLMFISLLLFLPVEGWGEEARLPTLVDVTREAGITFVHGFGDDQLSNIVESTGAGVALFDYDGDLDLDIYLVNGGHLKSVNHPKGRSLAGKLKNALYRNDGQGRFTDVTDVAGVGDAGYGMACLAGDYDNDGDADLFVTNYGPNVFYRNDGNGAFTDITAAAGLGGDLWSTGCTFFDYDRDGFLDLYVGSYLQFDPEYQYYYAGDAFPGPLSYPGRADILFHNRGDGSFEDVTMKAGVHNPDGRAMGVASCDIDDDGYMDIFVANDAMENYLYRNNHDGTFTDIALESGVGFAQNGEATSAMGPEFGDFNLDGLIDLLVPDMGYGCLYLNTSQGVFHEMSARLGMAAVCGQYTSWSGNFFDFDGDGFIDIFLTNGDSRFYEPEEDLLLRNIRGEKLMDVSRFLGKDFQKKAMGRGSAVGDLDGDGDLDIVILNINDGPRLLRNDGGNRNHWLMLHLQGARSNRDAIGARVRLHAGGAVQTRYVVSASGYLSQSDYRVHFGLGAETAAEKIRIRWPDGKDQTLKNVKANQVLQIKEN
ncbi:MAG: CRTAC1 family protein [Desulfobacterales bacterium]|nr:CRTAC1 family protein [Desulfobacterales bacterium]